MSKAAFDAAKNYSARVAAAERAVDRESRKYIRRPQDWPGPEAGR
jgi:hypothetical protein